MTRIRALRDKLGRRGTVLLLYSIAFAALGVKGFLSPSEDEGRFVLYTFLPGEVRLLLWGVPVFVGIVSAFSDRDAYGFALLTIPPTVLSISYFYSTGAYFAGVTDYPAGWARGLSWAVLGLILIVTAGWEDPPKPAPLPVGTAPEEEAKPKDGSPDAA